MCEDYFRVIEILDEYSILINYGSEHGAEEGEKIRIISIGPEIIDPLTEELLGTLDFVKSRLTVVTTYEKFSICKKIKTTTKSILANPLSQFQTTSTDIKALNVDKESITNKQAPNDRVIKVGDIVEIID